MDAALSYKERVRVAWDGVIALDGTVRKRDAALSASGYVLAGNLRPLEADGGQLRFSVPASRAGLRFRLRRFSRPILRGVWSNGRIKIAGVSDGGKINAAPRGAAVTTRAGMYYSARIWGHGCRLRLSGRLSAAQIPKFPPGMVAGLLFEPAPCCITATGPPDPVTLESIAHRSSAIQPDRTGDLVPRGGGGDDAGGNRGGCPGILRHPPRQDDHTSGGPGPSGRTIAHAEGVAANGTPAQGRTDKALEEMQSGIARVSKAVEEVDCGAAAPGSFPFLSLRPGRRE